MASNKDKFNTVASEPTGSPKHHPAEDICSSADHDRSCFSLMGWADTQNVESWLNMRNVFNVECTTLGANISGSLTREMDVVTKAGPEGEEIRHRFVRKIGVHDKGLGRCREAVFYLQFNPPENATDKMILERARNSPLKQLRQYIPRCYFAHFDNTGKLKEKMAIVIERIDGVDSGYFFGRHSPLNWKFKVQSDIDKILAPWTAHGITERHVCLATAKIAASIHGPYWNRVNDDLLHNEMFEHAARRDLFLDVFDEKKTGDEANGEEVPSYFTEAMNRSKNIWEAEKKRCADQKKLVFEYHQQQQQAAGASGNSLGGATNTTTNSSSEALLPGGDASMNSNASGDVAAAGDTVTKTPPRTGTPPRSPSLTPAHENSNFKCSPQRSPPSLSKEDERPFGFSELMCNCLDAAFEKSTWKNYLAELRAHPATLVHGDFHPANMVVETPKSDVRDENKNPEDMVTTYLVDFEMFGFGSGPQELGQYMISHARHDVRKAVEGDFVDTYIRHLQNDFGVAKDEKEVQWIKREYVMGGAGRWLWFLPILMSLGSDKNFRKYFHDQVFNFFIDHRITPDTVPLVRI